jgi:hypothetical protein
MRLAVDDTRASFDLVRLGIVSNKGCLGLGYLHQTVFLYFGQSQVLFVPLQTAVYESMVNPSGVAR